MGDRQPNEGLRKLFAASGWTLRQFAREVNKLATERGRPTQYQPASVHQWLVGHMPREDVRPLVIEALSRRLGRPVTITQAGFPAPAGMSERGVVDGLLDLGEQDMDPSRRSVLGTSLFSVALAIPGWQDIVGRMEAVATGRTQRIGMADVESVQMMTNQISDLEDRFGGRQVRPMAVAFLVNTVAPHLTADAREPVREAMMSAASRLCYLTGYMAWDDGVHGIAQRYYVKSLELAGAANDFTRYGATLRGMSVQATDLRQGTAAVRFADAAATACSQMGPRMRGFIIGQQAYAAAQVGDRAGALRGLRVAELAVEKAEAQGEPGRYTPAALNDHISYVRYELGDVRGSAEALQRADHLRADVYRGSRVRKRQVLAERQFALGHLEAACETWHSALDDVPLVQSGRVDRQVTEMFRLIRFNGKKPTARHLHERARTVAPRLAA